MRYDIWNSTAPAKFIRTGTVKKNTYTSNEYMLLTLTSRIAEGATGVAHTARLEILANGCVCNLEVIVKLAFNSKQTRRLRHEHTIYMHLAANGVEEGIPYVFGLFEDVETKAMALIMSHEGKCLLQKPVSELSEGANIHRAGVRHRDIRLQNLAARDDDHVAIIDFDRAKLEPSEKAKKSVEMYHLLNVLKGDNDDPWMSASTPSTKSSYFTPSKNWSDEGDYPDDDDDDETYDNGNNEHGSEGKAVSHDASAEPDEPDARGDMFKESATPGSPHVIPNPEVTRSNLRKRDRL
ncbi:hypothetical protein H0H87_003063 [Tephrocybe sp. NHM501043]|nr:hypothetical protein H0H87_003063 [Tephrocybe sp. NHM501043]